MSTDCTTRPASIEEIAAAAGGYSALARALQIKHPAIFYWRSVGRVPAERVPAVAAATGIPHRRIRPDLYPE